VLLHGPLHKDSVASCEETHGSCLLLFETVNMAGNKKQDVSFRFGADSRYIGITQAQYQQAVCRQGNMVMAGVPVTS